MSAATKVTVSHSMYGEDFTFTGRVNGPEVEWEPEDEVLIASEERSGNTRLRGRLEAMARETAADNERDAYDDAAETRAEIARDR